MELPVETWGAAEGFKIKLLQNKQTTLVCTYACLISFKYAPPVHIA